MFKRFLKRTAVIIIGIGLAVSLPLGAYAAPKSLSKGIKKGDTVYFGKYEQDGNEENGKEKIEWWVLDKQGNKALLISRYILDAQPYNKELKEVTWENCTLRKWLNEDFLSAGFSDDEQKRIKDTRVVNKDAKTEAWHRDGGKDTTDKVFCLSINEAKKYFKDDNKGSKRRRVASVTNYAIKQTAKAIGEPEESRFKWFERNVEGRNYLYWLRSPGDYLVGAAAISSAGSLNDHGYDIDEEWDGCRPALWVELN